MLVHERHNLWMRKETNIKLVVHQEARKKLKLLRMKTICKLRRLESGKSSQRQTLIQRLDKLKNLKVDHLVELVLCPSAGVDKELLSDELFRDTLESLKQLAVKQPQKPYLNRDSAKDMKSYTSRRNTDFLKHKNQRDLVRSQWKRLGPQSTFIDSLNSSQVYNSKSDWEKMKVSNQSHTLSLDLQLLHPSWRAKRWRREWEKSLRFEGNHIYFT